MRSNNAPVTVHILDKEYRILCQDGEQNDLLASARYLDMRMRDIRNTGKVIGSDRIAVMAALNIAHELLKHQQSKDESAQSLSRRIHSLQKKVEIALNSGNQLEL